MYQWVKDNLLWRNLLPFFLGTTLYFSWFIFFVGLRTEHIFLYFLTIILYLFHHTTRKFILAFSVFIVYWIIYDSMRIIPNYTVNPVHIAQPYLTEKQMFGIEHMGLTLTLNEFFKITHTPLLDFLAGFFYLNWVPIPLIFGFWLMRNEKKLFLKFSYAFLFTNIIGFCIYYLYPAAPPWYVDIYGFDLKYDTPGYAAGLLNFDSLTGTSIFKGLYSKNANVFAAIPSLHSSYPVLCFLYGWRLKRPWLNLIFGVFTLGIWFSAVYTGHHYLIDVLGGLMVAVTGYTIFEYLSEQTKLKTWFENFVQKI